MRAMVLSRPAPIDAAPLRLTELPVPEPGTNEIRVRVEACGICRTVCTDPRHKQRQG